MKIRLVVAELFIADIRTEKCWRYLSLFAILRKRLKTEV